MPDLSAIFYDGIDGDADDHVKALEKRRWCNLVCWENMLYSYERIMLFYLIACEKAGNEKSF